MRLISITLTNFGSWRGEHTIEFSERGPGLHLIRGRNEVEPRLGSNGSGKTTLINAWRWCWYGKTARGVGAGNIRSWDSKETTEVVVSAEVRGRHIAVRRTQAPNTLRLFIGREATDVTQDDVERELGIAEDLFDHALTVPQFHTFFFDLQPAAKLSLFSQLLDLDFWTDKSKHAARLTSAHDDKVKAAAGAVSRIDALIETHTTAITRLKERADTFEDETEDAIRDLRKQLVALDKRIDEQEKAVERSKAALAAARRKSEIAKKERAEQLEAERGARDWVAEERQKQQSANDRRAVLLKQRERLDADECPVCGQAITDMHRKMEDAKLKAETTKIDRELEDLGVRIDAAKAALEAAKLPPEDDSKDFAGAAAVVANKDQNDFDALIKDRKRAKLQLATLKDTKNPHDEELAQVRRDLSREKLARADAVRNHDRLVSETATLEYWIKGFKDIRLSLIDDALDTFEVETNNALSQIGMADWTLEFDVERETKAGTVSKGFAVNVLPPNRKESVPWACWSGGETQRLRAAGTFGLSALILAQCGIDSEIEIYDEPCQHLSPEGIDDLLSLLAHRARTLNKQIWLIEHRALDFGDFASVLSIVKDDTGSHVESAAPPKAKRRRIKE